MTVENTPITDVLVHTYDAIPDNDLYVYIVVITGDVYVYLTDSVCTLTSNWGGWVLEMPNGVNWVPSGHDKVPPMIGGAMPLLNPTWNTEFHNCSVFGIGLTNRWSQIIVWVKFYVLMWLIIIVT